MKELYERITHIRKKSGLSIAEFAAKIGLASSSLQNIETGRMNPSLEVILKIDSNWPQYGLNWLLYGEPMKAGGGVDIKNCQVPEAVSYKLPDTELLSNQYPMEQSITDDGVNDTGRRVEEVLNYYQIAFNSIEETVGPNYTLYEINPGIGMRMAKVPSLSDDIALSIASKGVRILAPIPGKRTLGIEVAHPYPRIVPIADAVSSPQFKEAEMALPVVIGTAVNGKVRMMDLAKAPHILIGGAKGQGKSVLIHNLIVSILLKKRPEDVKFVMIDTAKVGLSCYEPIAENFMAILPDGGEAVICDTDKAVQALENLCLEMDNRYALLKKSGCRDVKEYNELYNSGQLKPEDGHRFMPYIVLVINEFSDLMLASGKDAEILLCRLAQLARAVGIHAVIATNRLTTGMITGRIKANFPTRIAFRVADVMNSILVIDQSGAQQLGGPGDLLYSYSHNEIERLQAPFTDMDAINRIVNHIAAQPAYAPYVLPEVKHLDCDSWIDEITDDIFEDDDCYVTGFSDEERAQLMKTLRQSMNDLDVIRKRFNKIMDRLK